jgi:hypothetical protein
VCFAYRDKKVVGVFVRFRAASEGKPYSYSNITMQPHPWNLLLQKAKNTEAVT